MPPSTACEILMLIAFGASWPVNVIKSYRVGTAKGKSILFLILIFSGYLVGITGKLLADDFKWYVMFFYLLNTFMVGLDIVMYIRNRRRDARAAAAAARTA